MTWKIDTEKCLVWDNDENEMVIRNKVYVHIVSNLGTIFKSAGPLYVKTGQEMFLAVQQLKKSLQPKNVVDF
jgi:hypothetical protein